LKPFSQRVNLRHWTAAHPRTIGPALSSCRGSAMSLFRSLVILLVLAGAGFGGWWWWTHRTDPAAADQNFNRGLDALNGEEWDRAIAHFTDAIRLDPKSNKLSSAYNNRGYARWRKRSEDDLTKAREDLTEAMAI